MSPPASKLTDDEITYLAKFFSTREVPKVAARDTTQPQFRLLWPSSQTPSQERQLT
jgi:cytochrome c553